MKIIFYDTNDFEINYFKENLKGNFKPHYLKKALDNNTLINKNYKNAEAISVFVTSDLTKEVLEKFPKLKFIFLRSAGYSNLDLNYCKQKGITVFNVANYGARNISEFVFCLILALSKNIFKAKVNPKQKAQNTNNLVGIELKDKTLGIIGMGLIGKNTATIAKCFGMKVLAYDIKKENNDIYTDLNTLFEKSDFISINCPLTKETEGLIDIKKLNLMKKSAFLINTARGEIVKTDDLYEALIKNKIGGAALDVIECEKVFQTNNFKNKKCAKKYKTIQKLIKLKNVIITPHIAYNTIEARERIAKTTLENIETCLNINSGTKNLVLL